MLFSIASILSFVFAAQGSASAASNNFNGPALYQITPPVAHGECPTWDNRTNTLYYVDIHAGKIYSYNYSTKEINSITLSGEVAPIVQSKSDPNLFIVGLNRSVVAVKWDGKNQLESQQILTTLAQDKPTSRLNDGKADSKGRLWFGTMGYETSNFLSPNDGTLFKITRDNIASPTPMITPVNISNGLAWNKANDKFYYIDSPSRQIAEYDYDNENGLISNRRVVFDLSQQKINAHPDGMTIDKDDNLWIALYGGGSIIKVNPRTGELLSRIAIPAEAVTSVMWGGPELDILFVTTSKYRLSDEEKTEQPSAGSVFALTNLGTNGLPVYEANILG